MSFCRINGISSQNVVLLNPATPSEDVLHKISSMSYFSINGNFYCTENESPRNAMVDKLVSKSNFFSPSYPGQIINRNFDLLEEFVDLVPHLGGGDVFGSGLGVVASGPLDARQLGVFA